MKVIRDGNTITEPVCLMIGNYDGVHLGHQRIISRAKELAAAHHCKLAVLSFDPHPLKVLAPEKAPLLLQTPRQKEALLATHDVDYYVVMTFDEALYTLSPEDFVGKLKAQVNFAHLIVGFNFFFGHKRSGNADTLRSLADKYQYTPHIIDAHIDGDDPISSSRIRRLVTEGRTLDAARLLGRPYFLEGYVAEGKGLGRDMKAPTANFVVEVELQPRFGVYASWCRVDGTWYRSITNFGIAPTVDRNNPRAETFLFDFDERLYGKHLVVTLGAFMRDEIKFPNVDTLKERIHQDVATRKALPDTQPPPFPVQLDP